MAAAAAAAVGAGLAGTALCYSWEKAACAEEQRGKHYSLAEVARHKRKEEGIWVTYKDGVYDITDFVDLHPGGPEKVMLGAGGAIDAYWSVFANHNTAEVREMLEEYRIGELSPEDRGKTSTCSSSSEGGGPYANDPDRSPVLKLNTAQPFNAETPPLLLNNSYLTPNDLFFVRNHLPVPEIDAASFRLEVSGVGMETVSLTLEELKTQFPEHTVTATLQCAGNRRAELAAVKPVKGISWTGGAIGTAQWTGVRLRDVLLKAGLQEAEDGPVQHVHLKGLDTNPLTGECYGASIPVEKALDPRGDCLLAYKMNGEDIPRDHGYPLRAVVPGTVGARNVKWLSSVSASPAEYDGQWQQRDYKGFSPSVDWSNVDFSSAPAIQELPVQSLVCLPPDGASLSRDSGEVCVSGVAWSGGGREVVRVDISLDGGRSWQPATLTEGRGQRRGRAWAWTFWEISLPLPDNTTSLDICCKAVDMSYNVQPDSAAAIWNLRGCLSNAWHRVTVSVK